MDVTTLNLLIGAGIATVSTLAATFVAGYLNRKNVRLQLDHDMKEANRLRRLDTLEELHKMIGAYAARAASFAGQVKLMSRNSAGTSKFAEMCDNLLMPFTEILTKIRIYTPELIPDFNEYGDANNDLIEAGSNYVMSGSNNSEQLDKSLNMLVKKTHHFYKKVELIIDQEMLLKNSIAKIN